MKKIIKFCKVNSFLLWILVCGFSLRIYYLVRKSGDLFVANLGGDSCYHYNVATNIASGLGPKTSFIFSYWFYHPEIPAYTDLYGPGYAAFLSIFLLFSDNFFSLRLANFLIGFTSIVITYFIGKKIHSKQLGLISAFFISVNFFHIENSTVVMREIYTLLLTQLFFLILFFISDKKKIFIFIIGLVTGLISLTTGIWPLYILILIFYIVLYIKKISLKYIFIFSAGFLISSIRWIIITKTYFGKIYYSNLSFYPYVESWSRMMLDKGLPEIDNFWNTINFSEYISNHFFWFIENLYKGSMYLTPTFVYFLSLLLIPLIFFGAIKLKKIGFILLTFSIIYFLGLSFASYALNGNLWPRHYLPILMNASLLLGVTILEIINYLSKKYAVLNNKKIPISIIVIAFFITIFGIEYKTSYWEKNDKPFYEFGEKIKKVTSNDDVIMYSVAVPDVWCVTGRRVVHDIAFGGGKEKNRLQSEIDKYNVSYILVDLSEKNYTFSSQKLAKVLKNYQNQKLEEIIQDKDNGYFLYKINIK